MTNHYRHTIVRTSDLVAYPKNSRTHSDYQITQIANSIKEFGFTNPVLIDDNGEIIAGHGRVLAAMQIDLEEIPAIIVDGLSEAQQKALVLADNKLALEAGWDRDTLKEELATLKLVDYDIDLIGFNEAELADIFEDEPIEPINPDGEGDDEESNFCKTCGQTI